VTSTPGRSSRSADRAASLTGSVDPPAGLEPDTPGTTDRSTFDRSLLAGPALSAARALLGARLVSGSRVGRIVEVEAYDGEADLASHARFGRTARNAVMFGPPGVAYVYLVYGMHECLNVVTEPDGRPAAVLIRAVEPVDGIAEMREARLAHALRRAGTDEARVLARARIDGLPSARLATGPGLVTAAFGISRGATGVDLLDPAGSPRIEHGEAPPAVEATARIGIAYAAEPWRSVPWRLIDPTSPAVSG
jgi:DNA-3-methyladenine glycosylase